MRLFPLSKVNSRRPRALRAAASAAIESLEGRRLLDATVLQADRSITDNPQTAGDFFGEVVATSGNNVVVGQPFISGASGLEGAGVVKLAINGVVTPIQNPEPEEFDFFGSAVTFIDANHFAVTSFENQTGDFVPKVYIFDLAGNNTATVVAPFSTDFGNTLAAVGGDLLVSAPNAGSGAGAVYRYNVDGTPVEHETAPGTGVFTNAYTLAGTNGLGVIMAADPLGETMLFSSGFGGDRRVYEIGFGGNVVAEYDEANDPAAGGSFAIDFNGTSVFVGDPNVGRVTQFARVTGGTVAPIVGAITNTQAFSGFGSSLAVNGDHVIVAAHGAGVVTVYDNDFSATIDALATTAGGQSFGSAAAVRNLSGQEFLVADPAADNLAGRLYVFDLADLAGQQPPPLAPSATLVEGDLIVTGSDGANTIVVKSDGSGLIVLIDGVQVGGSFAVTGKVVVHGGAGNDSITSDASNPFPTQIHGGDGNDTITGGGGNDVLLGEAGSDVLYASNGSDIAVGGDGNDQLFSGNGRDVLIGGSGSDSLEGENGEDILVGGYTLHDGDVTALASIRAIWNSGDSYSVRVATLADSLLDPASVFDDGEEDLLAGGRGQDWLVVIGDEDTIS